MDGWMDGREDGWMDGQTDRLMDGRMDGYMQRLLSQQYCLYTEAYELYCADNLAKI